MAPQIASIVEGKSEVESLPILLRRILWDDEIFDLQIAKPFRVNRTKVVKQGELERSIRQLVRDRSDVAGIIIVLDADDDCPAQLASKLLERSNATTQLPVSVVMANREYEAWLLGAKESLKQTGFLKSDAQTPADPESIRGAKEKLRRNMLSKYSEVTHQPVFTNVFDFHQARETCPSLDKLIRDVKTLAATIAQT